jgi:hypothetical protein
MNGGAVPEPFQEHTPGLMRKRNQRVGVRVVQDPVVHLTQPVSPDARELEPFYPSDPLGFQALEKAKLRERLEPGRLHHLRSEGGRWFLLLKNPDPIAF